MDTNGTQLPETTRHTPLKVYCDASHNPDTDISTAGWVISDHNGAPITVDSQNLGSGLTSKEAEDETIQRAISELATRNGVNHLIVFTDSKNSVDETYRYAEWFEYIDIRWISRDDNMMADAVSRKAMESPPSNSTNAYGICD